jgi:hypothetical protein
LLANDIDTNGDSLTVAGVNSPSAAGGTVGLTNNWIYYAPPAGWTSGDTFTYTVSDGHCETDTGTVVVQVMADNPQPGKFGIGTPAGNAVQLSFTGIADNRYEIDYTDSLVNPVWQVLTTQPTDQFGVCEFSDTSLTNKVARYYRVVPLPATPVESGATH